MTSSPARFFAALLLAIVAFPAYLVASPIGAAAPPADPPIPGRYAIADLGTLPGWHPNAFPHTAALNDAGQVVGWAAVLTGGEQGFLYQNGTLSPLASLTGTSSHPLSINTTGEIVGAAWGGTPPFRAVRWQGGVPAEITPTLGAESTAYGINDSGQIVGTAEPTDIYDYTRPVLWQNGALIELTPPGEAYGVAFAIAATGNIAGVSGPFPGSQHATLWRDGVATNLGVPAGHHSSVAVALNNDDAVVGYADSSTDYVFATRAYLWRDGAANDLGTLGGDQSMAHDINDAGQSVGWAETVTYEQRAVIWAAGHIVDLNERLPAGSGWLLREARAINASGQIVGWGLHDGAPRAFLLTPEKEEDTRALTLTATGPGTAQADQSAATYAPGATVSITATPDPGAIFAGWMIDGAFAGWDPTNTLTMDIDHSVRATFLRAPSAFGDVPGGPEAAAIAELTARGIARGYDDGHFGPADPLQRAQAAAFVSRALFPGKSTVHSFGADVWFDDRCAAQECVGDELWGAVGQLADLWVVQGYGDRTFRPFGQVTEYHAIVIITRAMVVKRLWQWQPDDPALYPGVPRLPGESILATWVHYAGAPPDRPAGTGWPTWNQPASRGWIARALWQALDSYWGSADQP